MPDLNDQIVAAAQIKTARNSIPVEVFDKERHEGIPAKIQTLHLRKGYKTFSFARAISRTVDSGAQRADIFVYSLTGGANAMNSYFKDLAELRVGAPPSSYRR